MAQCAETEKFLKRVITLPTSAGVSLDAVLAPSINDEAELRRLFATSRNDTRLKNPYVGLVDVFAAPASIRTTRTRVFKDKEESAKYVFPLSEEARRKEGSLCITEDLDQFKKNWAVFSEGVLSQLTDWNNVVAAGGSVLACLLPLSDNDKESKRNMRKYFHKKAFPTSDMDLFLWGLDEKQAEIKINQIYEAVRDSVPWDVTCVRTKNVISIHCQYPYRTTQIVLRLYQSPAEILAGFDLDCGCVLYNGSRVFANPRAIVSMMRQCNTVDMSRRSPSYEIRLAKYAARGFEIYISDLRRENIDPTIYERAFNSVVGLARLLVLEKITSSNKRISYLEDRRSIRSRPTENQYNGVHWRRLRRRQRQKLRGDFKADIDMLTLETSEYDKSGNVGLHIPYGPGWDAARINRLIYKTDLGINSTFNPKNKKMTLHRHPAFFGTMEECLGDCCRHCPEPQNDEDRALQEQDDEFFVRDRVSFMKIDPGRQSMTGSFRPIDVGEWSEQAYVGPIEKLFSSIVSHDMHYIKQYVAQGMDINRRDYVGRTPLQMAIMIKNIEVASYLIDNGARMTARLVDGRTSLHLAAGLDLPDVLIKLLERSRWNEEMIKNAKEAAKRAGAETDDESETERPSSEDDWSSDDNKDERNTKKSVVEISGQHSDVAAIPEDDTNQPDVIDVNVSDWDLTFSALGHAIVAGSVRSVDILLAAGASYQINSVSQPKQGYPYHSSPAPILHPLLMPILTLNEKNAVLIMERLIHAGATTSQSNLQSYTIMHALVVSGKRHLVETALRNDPNARPALNILFLNNANIIHPLVSAIASRNEAMIVLLLLHGANTKISMEEIEKQALAGNIKIPGVNNKLKDYHYAAYHPIETAITSYSDLVDLLAQVGADVSTPCKCSLMPARGPSAINTLIDWIRQLIPVLEKEDLPPPTVKILEAPTNPRNWFEQRDMWQSRLENFRKSSSQQRAVIINNTAEVEAREAKERQIAYFRNMLLLLEKYGAKAWTDIKEEQLLESVTDTQRNAPLVPLVASAHSSDQTGTGYTRPNPSRLGHLNTSVTNTTIVSNYKYMNNGGMVATHQKDQYDTLFEACWMGDNAKIEDLCLPNSNGSNTTPLPLQITVEIEAYHIAPEFRHRTPGDGTYNPFAIAVIARKWETAKLILAIATAQFKMPGEPETVFLAPPITLRDGDEDEDYASDVDSDVDYVPREVFEFQDFTKRPSLVQCNVSPEMLLHQVVGARLSRDGTKEIPQDGLLRQALREEDFETFVHLADLMKLLPGHVELPFHLLNFIMIQDLPNFLDEFIRRTGLGISIDEQKEEEPEINDGKKFISKVYLGLDVEGKKRKDLATSGQAKPIRRTTSETPLLWHAVLQGSHKIIRFLKSPAPLAAYRYYAASGSGEWAELLRKTDFAIKMPSLLGVFPNSRNETVFTAVCLSQHNLETAKLVLSLYPEHAKTYLHSKILENNMTTLLLAVSQSVDIPYIDWLLDQGVYAEAVDYRGWNIYHFVCEAANAKILEHLLQKLPQDVTSRLLSYTTREGQNTPLLLAVKRGAINVVKMLFEKQSDSVDICLQKYNASGLTPIHVAVRAGFADITRLLVSRASILNILNWENAVGETPIETARILWLLYGKSKDYFPSQMPNLQFPAVASNGLIYEKSLPVNAEKLKSKILEIKDIMVKAAEQGILWQNTKLKEALETYVTLLQSKLESTNTLIKDEPDPVFDHLDRLKTFKVMEAVDTKINSIRRLVQLHIVQKSVITSLEKF